ncbi:ROK family protein [Alphaproteobacteria bacterium LSUCC0719]
MNTGPAIAVDLGGTQLRVALVAGNRLLDRVALPTDTALGPAGICDQIVDLIERVTGRPGTDRTGMEIAGEIAGIGMCCAGPINTETGTVTDIPTLPGWEGFALAATLSQRTGLRVRVENDGIAAALGEWRHGAGQGARNMVYLTVSTGIGGGAVVDGRLLRGHKGISGHIGHMRLAQNGPRCHCGVVGCFEALASGTALKQRALDAVSSAASPYLASIAAGTDIDARDVVAGARAGDPHCLQLVADEAMYLGQGITSAIHMFSPERVIMGGGLAHAFDLLEPGIHDVIRRDALVPFRQVRVMPAALGDDSGLLGAAALILEPQDS